MNLDYLVPSWFEIESRVTDHMGYQGGAHFRTYSNEPVASLALNLRRVDSVRKAFIHAEWQAAHLLRQRFAELDINSIVDELIDVVKQIAMIVAGSAITGGLLGAGIGAFGGGAGALPLGAAGAAMGLKVRNIDTTLRRGASTINGLQSCKNRGSEKSKRNHGKPCRPAQP